MREKKKCEEYEKGAYEISKRNERERIRVSTVNQAFMLLQRHLPSIRSRSKRVSKLRILKTAINYIQSLQELLQDSKYIQYPKTYSNEQITQSNAYNNCWKEHRTKMVENITKATQATLSVESAGFARTNGLTGVWKCNTTNLMHNSNYATVMDWNDGTSSMSPYMPNCYTF